MTNDYFNHGSALTQHTLARASQVNAIFQSIVAGLDKLPDADPLNQGRVTYVTDTGSADAYVVSLAKAPSSYVAGLSIVMKAANTNTGASTVNVNSLGVKSIKRYNGDDLVANDIVTGALIHLVYDGTNFRIVGANGAESALAKEWATSTSVVSGGLKGSRGYAQDASASASAAGTSETNAQAQFDAFQGIFYGSLSSDPATDPNGDPPDEGDWYYNTSAKIPRIFDGSVWKDIGAARLSTFVFTATGGETSLSGADDNGNTLAYTVDFILLHKNGALFTPDDDYTADDGTSITGLSAATAGDVFVIDAFASLILSDVYTKDEIDEYDPEHATDSGTDAYVSAENTTAPGDGKTIRRDFQSANTTTTPTLDGLAITDRDGNPLWAKALSGVHDLQYDDGEPAWRVVDPLDQSPRSNGGVALVFATAGTASNDGAAGDGDGSGGGTGDSDALQALFDEISAAGGGVLDGEGKIYRVESQLSLKSDVVVRNMAFDYSSTDSDDTMIEGGGSQGSDIDLDADAEIGDRSLELVDNTDLSALDWIMIERDRVFNVGENANVVSELVRVSSVEGNGTTVNLEHSIEYAYPTSDNARVSKLTPVKNTIFERCSFIGNTDRSQQGIFPYIVENMVFRDCRAEGWTFSAFGVRLGWNCRVDNCQVNEGESDTDCYGVYFSDGCHWCTVDSLYAEDVRHAVSVAGGEFMNRHIKVVNSFGIGTRDAAFDSHRDCDHFYISGCTAAPRGVGVNEGIISQAARTTITDNTVVGDTAGSYGIRWQPLSSYADIRPAAVISNNKVLSTTGAVGIRVELDGSAGAGPFLVNGNVVKASVTEFDYGIEILSADANAVGVSVNNNTVHASQRGIQFTANADQSIERGTIVGNTVEMTSTDNNVEAIRLNGSDADGIRRINIASNITHSGDYSIRGVNDNLCYAVANLDSNSSNGISLDGAGSSTNANSSV